MDANYCSVGDEIDPIVMQPDGRRTTSLATCGMEAPTRPRMTGQQHARLPCCAAHRKEYQEQAEEYREALVSQELTGLPGGGDPTSSRSGRHPPPDHLAPVYCGTALRNMGVRPRGFLPSRSTSAALSFLGKDRGKTEVRKPRRNPSPLWPSRSPRTFTASSPSSACSARSVPRSSRPRAEGGGSTRCTQQERLRQRGARWPQRSSA